jgi:hypothetical protein
MSRAAVYSALSGSVALNALGVNADNIHANWSLDTPPSRSDPFLVLRWEEQILKGTQKRGPRLLTVWAHIPKQKSTDHADLDPILRAVSDALLPLVHVVGSDSIAITGVEFRGESPDLDDVGYDTIVRNAAYEVLARAV